MTAKKLHFFQKPLKPLKILAIKATACAVATYLYLLYIFPYTIISFTYFISIYSPLRPSNIYIPLIILFFIIKLKDLIRMSKLYETHPIYHVNPKVRFKISKENLQNFEHSRGIAFAHPVPKPFGLAFFSFLILS